MQARFTYHATDRIANRLRGLVSAAEIAQAIERAELKPGENHIDVKQFSKRIYLGEPTNPDTPKGDKITARVVVDECGATVVTVVLRKSTSRTSCRLIN